MFPEFIKQLPQVNIPVKEIQGHLLQTPSHQVVFWTIKPGAFPAHKHGAQYSVILEGTATMVIGNETKQLKKGDELFIPEGQEHNVTVHSTLRVLDIFAQPDFVKSKP